MHGLLLSFKKPEVPFLPLCTLKETTYSAIVICQQKGSRPLSRQIERQTDREGGKERERVI